VKAIRKPDVTAHFARVVLPWLLAGGMLVVYALTLEHWIAPGNLHLIAWFNGWPSSLARFGPVFHLVTYPVRWLPVGWRLPAMNLFTAVCAATSLGLLARTVALLPHDRTAAERERNKNAAGFLTLGSAWVPPLVAVLVGGLQITFWEQGTTATGEMFDLVLFAWMVRCVLEYRVSRREGWLLQLAFVGGLGVANDWAMVAFVPGFLVAMCWVAGISGMFTRRFVEEVVRHKWQAFNFRLPARILGCWLAGCAAILLVPLLAADRAAHSAGYWAVLGASLHEYHVLLMTVRWRGVLLLCATPVLPILFMGIRWDLAVGEFHRWAKVLGNITFHIIHGLFLVACLWTVLDAPFSARHLQPVYPCLPLGFLVALSVGYFTGYFLLVSQLQAKIRGGYLRPQYRRMNRTWTTAICVMLLGAAGLLAWKNLPQILRERSGLLASYCEVLEKSLPPSGAVILGQDPARLECLDASLLWSGDRSRYVLVDTRMLDAYPQYIQFLAKRHPEFNLPARGTNRSAASEWVRVVAQKHDVYSMHPFVGYLGELFNAEPAGLFWQFTPSATNYYDTRTMAPDGLAQNRGFWRTVEQERFPELLGHLQPKHGSAQAGLLERVLKAAHVPPEPDRVAVLVGSYYSLALDSWGVALQRDGLLEEAGKSFEEAHELNPDSIAAQLNRQFNQDLRAHKPVVMDSDRELEEKLGRHKDWYEIPYQEGPVDEPNACYRLGTFLAGTGLPRQAIEQYERVRRLAPEYANAPLRLAELFLGLGEPAKGLVEAEEGLRIAPGNERGLYLKGVGLVQMDLFHQAVVPLTEVLGREGTNYQARLLRGFAYQKIGNLPGAQEDYEQAAKLLPGSYAAYYHLAGLARQRRDSAATIKNCELYLSSAAPADRPETEEVKAWLKEVRPSSNQGP
jgi:tetratricopeptide (TPR) repeat protein